LRSGQRDGVGAPSAMDTGASTKSAHCANTLLAEVALREASFPMMKVRGAFGETLIVG